MINAIKYELACESGGIDWSKLITIINPKSPLDILYWR